MGLTLFKKSSVLVHSSVIPKQKQSKQSLLLLALALKVPAGQMPSGFWRITTASCPGCPQPVNEVLRRVSIGKWGVASSCVRNLTTKGSSFSSKHITDEPKPKNSSRLKTFQLAQVRLVKRSLIQIPFWLGKWSMNNLNIGLSLNVKELRV